MHNGALGYITLLECTFVQHVIGALQMHWMMMIMIMMIWGAEAPQTIAINFAYG